MFRLLEGPRDAAVLGLEFHQRCRRASLQRVLHGTSYVEEPHSQLIFIFRQTICEALDMSYRAVKTATRYDVPFRRYFGESKVRADSEHVPVFTSELGSYTNGLASDQSRATFGSNVP